MNSKKRQTIFNARDISRNCFIRTAVVRQINKPTKRSINKLTSSSATQPAPQLVGRSVSPSVSQSFSKSLRQPASQPASLFVCQSAHHLLVQPVSGVCNSICLLVSWSVNEPVRLFLRPWSVSQPIHLPLSQPAGQSISMSIGYSARCSVSWSVVWLIVSRTQPASQNRCCHARAHG